VHTETSFIVRRHNHTTCCWSNISVFWKSMIKQYHMLQEHQLFQAVTCQLKQVILLEIMGEKNQYACFHILLARCINRWSYTQFTTAKIWNKVSKMVFNKKQSWLHQQHCCKLTGPSLITNNVICDNWCYNITFGLMLDYEHRLYTWWVIITGTPMKSGISLLLGHIYGYNLAWLIPR